MVLPITHKERFKALGIKPPKGTRSYSLLNLYHVCVFIFSIYLFSFWHVRLFLTHSGVLMYVSRIWTRLFLYYGIVATMSLSSFVYVFQGLGRRGLEKHCWRVHVLRKPRPHLWRYRHQLSCKCILEMGLKWFGTHLPWLGKRNRPSSSYASQSCGWRKLWQCNVIFLCRIQIDELDAIGTKRFDSDKSGRL